MDPAENGVVLGRDGLRGVLESAWAIDRESTVRLADGRRIVLEAGLLKAGLDGTYHMEVGPGEVHGRDSEVVLPIVEEFADVSKRTIETGRVRVVKTVDSREEVVDVPLWRDDVQVERVAVGRVIDGPVEIRREGDTTIVPLVEEVLVVEKRLVLREEIRITTRRTEERRPSRVELRREHAEVERLDAGAGRSDIPDS